MIQSSSKRLSKIKKKLKKNDASDYSFLIGSLQRDSNKQNYASNQLNVNKTSLKNSIQLKKSAMINSFDNYKHRLNESIDNRQCSKINIKNSGVPFFQNVKFLKNSRIQQQQLQQNQPKFVLSKQGYKKNIELSQNVKSKYINDSGKNQKSNKFVQNQSDTIEQKLQAYVEFVNELFQELYRSYSSDKSNPLSRKKCLLQTLGKQLLRQVKKNYDVQTMKALNKSIQVSNFSSFPSKIVSRQLQRSISLKQKPQDNGYKKLIDQLSHQNFKLTQLISEHERKNIKMFIKMNENQSKQIERCKKYLSTLYDKYKLLQKSLIKENQKFKKVSQQKLQLEKKVQNLQKKSQDLTSELQTLNQILQQIHNQNVSKLSFEQQSSNTTFNFNLIEHNNKKSKIQPQKNNQSLTLYQNSKMDRSFITKRDKASSCLSTHLNADIKNKDEEIMSCSTITKNKNMKKKKPKPAIGINLKDQFNEDTQDNVIHLKKELNSTKEKLNQENVVKLALQKQLNNLQGTLKKKTEKTQKMQAIINEQIQEIQKLIELNSQLTNELKRAQNNDCPSSRKHTSRFTGEIFQQINQLNHIKNNFTIKDTHPSRAAILQSEYRIIAMQAGLIQNFINSS